MAKISARKSRDFRKYFVSLSPTNELIHSKPNKIMKKLSAQTVIIILSILMLVGAIMRCRQRTDEPPREIIEAAEEASRQVPEQGPAPEMKRIEPADSAETADPVLTAQMERQYFEALTKMADGGKVYALDADGKRSPKAFTRFDDYEQFVAENTQYVRRRYSYDADGKPFEIEVTKTSVKGNVTDIEEKIEAVPAKSE